MPIPDLRTLDGLRAYLPVADRATTPAARAFGDLRSALAAHASALGRLDRAEARFIAARGGVDADRPAEATGAAQHDEASHDAPEGLGRYVGPTVPSRPRQHGRGSRRRSFNVRQMREDRLAGQVREAVDRLHHAPAEACGDVALKLAAVIAAGEAGPPDATAFPWCPLRHLLADVTRLGVVGS